MKESSNNCVHNIQGSDEHDMTVNENYFLTTEPHDEHHTFGNLVFSELIT